MNKLAIRVVTGVAAVAVIVISGLVATSSAESPKSPASKPASASAPAPTEKDFLAVMQARCVRCHKQCKSVDEMKKSGWIKPGLPDRSAVYTVIGKTRKPGAKYHDVADKEKTLIRDFVVSLGTPPATTPASGPARKP